MAEYYVTMDQLDVVFADYAQKGLKLNDEQVLIEYQEKGIKSSLINEDVVYVKTHSIQDEVIANKFRKSKYNQLTGNQNIEQTTMTSVMVVFTAYGPNSVYLLTKLNNELYLDSSKQFFYKNNMALVPDRTEFVTDVHEKINERYWQRSDLKVYFYTSYTFGTEVGVITDADIKIEPGIIISR